MRRGEVWWTEILVEYHPVLLLSRDAAYEGRNQVTVALVTSTVRGIASEVQLDQEDGMLEHCCVNLDNIFTIPKYALRTPITLLSPERMDQVRRAVMFSLGISEGPLAEGPIGPGEVP